MSELVASLMVAYFVCTYFIAYKFTMLVFHAENGRYYGFRARWYHKAAGTYVLALPIFIFLVYLIEMVSV